MAKKFTGIVASDKPNKTIIVSILVRKTHPLYRKQYSVTNRFVAHDEKNEARVGDSVEIIETRPISATKRFKLVQILQRAVLNEDDKKAITQTEVEA
jgi:small subunit ribosomal protein S17